MIFAEINIMSIATPITALSALITGFYLWYDRRARIIVSIEPIEHIYYLTIENIGRSVARDVKIRINKEFIESLPVDDRGSGKLCKAVLKKIQLRKFHYTPGLKKYYYLIPCEPTYLDSEYKILCSQWYDNHRYLPIKIEIEYNSWFELKEEFILDQFNSEAFST